MTESNVPSGIPTFNNERQEFKIILIYVYNKYGLILFLICDRASYYRHMKCIIFSYIDTRAGDHVTFVYGNIVPLQILFSIFSINRSSRKTKKSRDHPPWDKSNFDSKWEKQCVFNQLDIDTWVNLLEDSVIIISKGCTQRYLLFCIHFSVTVCLWKRFARGRSWSSG